MGPLPLLTAVTSQGAGSDASCWPMTIGRHVPRHLLIKRLDQGSAEVEKQGTWITTQDLAIFLASSKCSTEKLDILHGQPQLCAVCSPVIRETTVWQTHTFAHSGMSRTISQLWLIWFWSRLTAKMKKSTKRWSMETQRGSAASNSYMQDTSSKKRL